VHATQVPSHQEPSTDAEAGALRAALERALQQAGQRDSALQAAQLESGLAGQMLQARPFLKRNPLLLQHVSSPGPLI
jgi:hypothetical protein